MSIKAPLLLPTICIALLPILSACVTQRTVTENGKTVQQGTVIRRPVKEAIQRSY